MSVQQKDLTIDRRTFLKVIGTAGATAAFVAACGPQPLGQTAQPVGAPSPELVAGLTGGKWEKSVALATAGPGGNLKWQPGDSLKFLPPEKFASGKTADTFAALPKDKILTAYQRMVTSRKWETKMKDLFVDGKDKLYGAFHMYVGEEAIANGVCTALNEDDYIVSTHRGHGHLIAKGGDLNKMSAEIFFKETGYNKAYGGSMHITDVSKGILGMNGIVGASWFIAAGAGYAAKVRGTKQVAVAFAGDGATNSMYFFNAVRNAALYKLPALFVIENNFQNVGVPMAVTTPTKYNSEYAKGLGIPVNVADGNDVAVVFSLAKEAIERARAGEGPSVLEFMTYRWYDHSGFAGAKLAVDGAAGLPYRTDDEVRQWMSRDPIVRFKTFLLERKLATESELTKIETDTQAAVEQSVVFARQSKDPDPKTTLANVYASGNVTATQFFNRTGLAT